jgi:hypothetical protein
MASMRLERWRIGLDIELNVPNFAYAMLLHYLHCNVKRRLLIGYLD